MKIGMSGTGGFPKVTVGDLSRGYLDQGENGVRGYGGKLNIRPAYQREFIYKDKQRNEVVNTVLKGFPLNTMYWAVAADGFEMIDGQQRTISICQYVQGDFAVDMDGSPMFFNNLVAEKQQQVLGYELSIYICDGSDKEKLDWFKIINIAGEQLSPQELRNAIYTGSWLADAKVWFSRGAAPAMQDGRDRLVSARQNRQEVLELALDWFTRGEIEQYMASHQHDKDAQELWTYWQAVFDWVKRTFPNQDSARTKLMKGLAWGRFYNDHKDDKLNPARLEKRITELLVDPEVTEPKGVFEYLLTGNEKTLSLRAFDERTKLQTYQKQKGVCPMCHKHYDIDAMEADHILPWSGGGKTVPENCQMLCKLDNRTKSGK